MISIMALVLLTICPESARANWNIETITATKSFSKFYPRAIAVEKTTNRPHMVYGGKHLYHAYYDGSQWQYETIDNSGGGTYASIAIDSNNKIHVSYYANALKYATNISGSWVISTIDTGNGIDVRNVGQYSTIAVDSNNKVHISYINDYYYYDISDQWRYGGTKLRYATNVSGSWITAIVDSSNSGKYACIAIDSNDRAHISYYDAANKDLKYATNASGSWFLSTIDSSGDVGDFTSVAVDSNNRVHISYHDITNGLLRYATNASGSWNVTQLDYVQSYNFGGNTSIVIDSNDKVYISYTSATSYKYATNASGSWITSIFDSSDGSSGSLEMSNSITIDSSNTIHISYYRDLTGELRYATNASGSMVTEKIDSGAYVRPNISMATDSNGKVQIVYTSEGIKYATNDTGSWAITTVDGSVAAEEARAVAIAIDSNNKAHMSYSRYYYDGSNWVWKLKYATNSSGIWATSTIATGYNGDTDIHNGPNRGGYTSIAVDSNNKAHISYADYTTTTRGLGYATNASGLWVISVIVDAGTGKYPSIAIDSNNKAHIGYFKDSNLITYSTNASGSWLTSTIDNHVGYFSGYTSIAIDSNDKVHISYMDDNGAGRVFYSNNTSGAWVKTEILYGGAYPTSIALDSNDMVHIGIGNSMRHATNRTGTSVIETIDTGESNMDRFLALDSFDQAHVAYSKNGDLLYATNAGIPVADFTGTPTSGNNPLTVNFTNTTTGGDAPLSYEWDFNNDGVVDSTEMSPSYVYTASGYYTVTLKVTDVHGDTDTVTKQDYVLVTTNSVPAAEFIGAPTGGCNQVTVNFTDLTTGGEGPLSYYWEFFSSDYTVYPNPTSSTIQNPTVYFEHYSGTNPTGYASVRLTVTDADGDVNVIVKGNYIRVDRYGGPGGCSGDVIANFSASPATGDAPLTVNFTNTTTLYTPPFSYEWDFENDGVVDSTEVNPSHTYNSVGTYTVKLKATDPYGRTGTKVMTDYISVKIGSVPTADFTGAPTSGSNPLTVNFTNTTTGGDAPLSYEWDFNNDGIVDSTEVNPSYVYTGSGSYTVTLKVTDTHGDADTVTKQNYVFVTTNSVPVADFTGSPTGGCNSVTVNFTDSTTGGDGPLSYYWEFFIGGFTVYSYPTSSTEQNPTVIFEHYSGTDPTGYASIRLTVTDADGDVDVIVKENYIRVDRFGGAGGCSGDVNAKFSALPISGDAPLMVSFTNSTTGYSPPFSYEWDFDNDGVVDSTDTNPVYTYNSAGMYTVKLKATDPYGRTATSVKTDYIIVVNTGDISSGWEHTLYVHSDGTLWAWGHNDQGQLGNGTRTDSPSPKQIGTDTNWVAVSAGWKHSLALKRNGTLWAWGDNDYGQTGNGTTTDLLSPVQIGTDSDWAIISAGGAHNLALKGDRTLWAWGGNFQGQIGDGTTTTRLSPLLIGNDTDWKALSAGWEHSMAVKSDGSLWTWGWNEKGQLGNGTTLNKTTPFQIGTEFSDAVSAGWKHTAAIKTDGTLWTWGYNEYGQLGDGTLTDRWSPVQVGSDTDWSKVAAGGAHTLAIKTDGSLWSWGGNWHGQIGDGTINLRLLPTRVGSENDWADISAGWEHSAGLKEDMSTLLTWGWNAYGQAGNGSTTDSYSPSIINLVKIEGTSLYYFLLQDAYDEAVNADTVLSRNVAFTGDLLVDLDKSVSLQGGYNSGFSTIAGKTIINGNVIISNGTMTIGNFMLE